MNGRERRECIIKMLNTADEAISGTALAKELKVSRQIIVQDIALLRAEDMEIMSTTKGYLIAKKYEKARRTFAVKHTTRQMEEELNLIVDCGGFILDVIVEHPVYGKISANLSIGSRQEVSAFIDRVNNSETVPLKELTKDVHRHTVEAQSEEVLNIIEEKLRQQGFLID